MASLQRSRPDPDHQQWCLLCSERDWKDSWSWLRSTKHYHLSTYHYCCWRLWTCVTVDMACAPLNNVFSTVWMSVLYCQYVHLNRKNFVCSFSQLCEISWASFHLLMCASQHTSRAQHISEWHNVHGVCVVSTYVESPQTLANHSYICQWSGGWWQW